MTDIGTKCPWCEEIVPLYASAHACPKSPYRQGPVVAASGDELEALAGHPRGVRMRTKMDFIEQAADSITEAFTERGIEQARNYTITRIQQLLRDLRSTEPEWPIDDGSGTSS